MRKISTVFLSIFILVFYYGTAYADGFQAIFMNVGAADCALFVCGNEAMLVDTGTAGSWNHIEEVLEGQGISDIKYMILTHPHADHIGGARKVADFYSVDAAILPPIEHSTETYDNMKEALERNGVQLLYPSVGDTYTLGTAEITIYGPHSVAYKDINDWSIVAMIRYASKAILMTGDIESEAEGDLLSYNDDFPLSADILKVAHHGSDTSSTYPFIQAVSPMYALVSCESNKKKILPSTDVAMTLVECNVSEILSTEVYGDIEVLIDPSGILSIGPMAIDLSDAA